MHPNRSAPAYTFRVHPDGYVETADGEVAGHDRWRAFGAGAIEPASRIVLTPNGQLLRLPPPHTPFQYRVLLRLADEAPIPGQDFRDLFGRVGQRERTPIQNILDPRRTGGGVRYPDLPASLRSRFTESDFTLLVRLEPDLNRDVPRAEALLAQLVRELDLPVYAQGALPGGMDRDSALGSSPPDPDFDNLISIGETFEGLMNTEEPETFVPSVIPHFFYSDDRFMEILQYHEAVVELLWQSRNEHGAYDIRLLHAFLDPFWDDTQSAIAELERLYRQRMGIPEPPDAEGHEFHHADAQDGDSAYGGT